MKRGWNVEGMEEGKEDRQAGRGEWWGPEGRCRPVLQGLHDWLPIMGPTGLRAKEASSLASAVRVMNTKKLDWI